MTTEVATAPTHRGPALWSVLLSAVACLSCPLCLGVLAAVLPALGHSLGDGGLHGEWAAVLVLVAWAASALTAWRSRRAAPFTVATVGTAVVLGCELLWHAESGALAGYLLLLGANVWSWRGTARAGHRKGDGCC